MTRRLAFESAARETYLELRKDPEAALYQAVRAALTELMDNPGRREVRRLRYRPDTWGMPVRCGDVRWLILWRAPDDDPDLIEVHYLGPAPGQA